MYKNQLQELAQRSCFNLPSYACIKEGPDHAARFKASVIFQEEIFEGPSYCSTLRQAEHAAAGVALNNLSTRATSRSLAARVLDETGVYKNLLQETAHRAGLKLPVYTTERSGPGHQPIFACSVELAGMSFSGEPAKTKKQAEKNAAMAAWSALKQMPSLECLQSTGISNEEQEQVVVARVLSNFKPKEENRPLRDQQLQQRRRMASFNNFKPKEQKQRGFPSGLRILPPQEPFPSSKDKSLFTSTRPVSAQIRIQEAPHKDEHSWINEVSDGKGKSIVNQSQFQVFGPMPTYPRTTPLPYPRPQHTRVSTRPCSPPPMGSSAAMQVPRWIGSGGFHGAGIAPAVNIRSVVPVCAVPPMKPPQTSSSVIQKKEKEEASAATSKLTKLQL